MLLISLLMVTDGVNDPGDSIVLTTERLESGAVLQGKIGVKLVRLYLVPSQARLVKYVLC